jgi:predicted ABC-type ATPase
VQASYQAAALAASDRTRRLTEGTSFVTETVFSHPSKLDLLRDARARGHSVWLIYIAVASVDISLRRVERRVRLGGHDVPPAKVVARTERSLQNLHPAVAIADRVDLYDNSDTTHAFRRVCRWENGSLVWRADRLADWIARLIDGA